METGALDVENRHRSVSAAAAASLQGLRRGNSILGVNAQRLKTWRRIERMAMFSLGCGGGWLEMRGAVFTSSPRK